LSAVATGPANAAGSRDDDAAIFAGVSARAGGLCIRGQDGAAEWQGPGDIIHSGGQFTGSGQGKAGHDFAVARLQTSLRQTFGRCVLHGTQTLIYFPAQVGGARQSLA
jgi:hypothetical protein